MTISNNSVPTFNMNTIMSLLREITSRINTQPYIKQIFNLSIKRNQNHNFNEDDCLKCPNVVNLFLQCKATTNRKNSALVKRIGHFVQFSQGCEKGNIVIAK